MNCNISPEISETGVEYALHSLYALFGRITDHRKPKGEELGDVFCLDGKVLPGTQVAGVKRSDQVLSLFDGTSQRVLAQEPIETKENEIVAAPVVLQRVDLTGKIVTADALHTQRKLSSQIVVDGDYVFPVKDNQERLRENIEQLFALENPKPGFGKIKTDFETATQVSYGHGRIEIRTIQTSEMLNEYLDWPGVKQVYRLDREFHWLRQGIVYKSSHEIEYGITSLSRELASPKKLLAVRRQHWSIETGLHYRRDVTFNEDATRMTKGKSGHILGTIRNLVLALLKSAGFTNTAKARRWFAGHLADAFALLLT